MNSAAGRAPTAIKASMCLDIQLFAVDIILGIMQRKTANVGFKQFDSRLIVDRNQRCLLVDDHFCLLIQRITLCRISDLRGLV